MADSNRPPPRDDGVAAAVGAARAVVVPVAQERVEIRSESTPAGTVRVRIEVEQGHERVDLAEVRDEYQASVHAVGRPVDGRRDAYLDGDDVVIPVYEERVVVERRLFLTEEIRLRRARHVFHQEQDVPVRRERAVFERLHADGSWHEVPLSPGAPVAEHIVPDSSAAATE